MLTAYSGSSGTDLWVLNLAGSTPTESQNICAPLGIYTPDFASAAVTSDGNYAFVVDANASNDGLYGLNEITVGTSNFSSKYEPNTSLSAVAVCGNDVIAAGSNTAYDFPISGSSLGTPTSVSIGGIATYIGCGPNNAIVGLNGGGADYFTLGSSSSTAINPPSGVTLTAINSSTTFSNGLFMTDGTSSNNIWLANGAGVFKTGAKLSGAESAFAFIDTNSPVVTNNSTINSGNASTSIPTNGTSGGEAVVYQLDNTPQTRTSTAGQQNDSQSSNNCSSQDLPSQAATHDPAAASNIMKSSCSLNVMVGKPFDSQGGNNTSTQNGSQSTASQLGGNTVSGNGNTTDPGKPVNSGTGNFTYQLPGITVPGVGPDLSFIPTYNSAENATTGQSNGSFDLGYGFSASPEVGLDISGSNATITQENGAQVSFSQSPCTSGLYSLDSGDVLGLGSPWCSSLDIQAGFYSNSSTSTYSFVRLAPTYEVFTYCNNSSGCTAGSNTYSNLQLETVSDKNGESLTVTYISGGSGQCPVGDSCIQYAKPNGQTTDRYLYIVENSGQVVSVSDGAHTITLTYCTSLTSVCATGDLLNYQLSSPAPTGGSITTPFSLKWEFQYDENNNLNAMNKVSNITNSTINDAAVTYADSALPTACQGAFGWVDSETDAMSETTTVSYCNYNTSTLTGQVDVTDPDNNSTLFTYFNGALFIETKGYGSSTPSTTAWERDPGSLMAYYVYDPNKNREIYSVDSFGRITSFTDAEGNASLFGFDESSLTASDFKHFYTPNWSASSVPVYESSPPNPSVVSVNGFDSNGNLTCTIEDSDASSSDSNNLYTVTPDESGSTCSDSDTDTGSSQPEPVTSYAWCTSGCPTGYLAGEMESATDPKGNTTNYSYDSSGDLADVKNALSNDTSFNYCSEAAPYSASCTLFLPPGGSSGITYTFAPGQLEYTITPNGNAASCSGSGCIPYETTEAFDPLGQVVESVSPPEYGRSIRR